MAEHSDIAQDLPEEVVQKLVNEFLPKFIDAGVTDMETKTLLLLISSFTTSVEEEVRAELHATIDKAIHGGATPIALLPDYPFKPTEIPEPVDDDDVFIPELLCCEVCGRVMIQPILAVPCGHNICRLCVQKGIDEDDDGDDEWNCQACQAPMDLCVVISRFEKHVHSNIQFMCPYQKVGCEFTGLVPEIIAHLEECPYRIVPCPNAELGCECEIARQDIDEHLANDCPFRLLECKWCGESVYARDLEEHEDNCEERIIRCPHHVEDDESEEPMPEGGCQWSGKPRELEDHLAECLFDEVACPYEERGCEWRGRRGDVAAHIEREEGECNYRDVECKFCGTVMPAYEFEEHMATCDEVIITCPHEGDDCEWEGRRGDLAEHLADECLYEECVCGRAELGCLWRGFRKDLEAHEAEECDYRELKCQWCDATVLAHELGAHEEACDERMIRCPNYNTVEETGCPWEGRQGDLEAHMVDCQYHPVPCKYASVGCTETGLRFVMLEHEEECPFRDVTCPYCGFVCQERELMDHMAGCDHRPVECEFCGVCVELCELEAHMAECPKRIVTCPIPGCDEQVVFEDLEAHASDLAFLGKHLLGLAQQQAELAKNGVRVTTVGKVADVVEVAVPEEGAEAVAEVVEPEEAPEGAEDVGIPDASRSSVRLTCPETVVINQHAAVVVNYDVRDAYGAEVAGLNDAFVALTRLTITDPFGDNTDGSLVTDADAACATHDMKPRLPGTYKVTLQFNNGASTSADIIVKPIFSKKYRHDSIKLNRDRNVCTLTKKSKKASVHGHFCLTRGKHTFRFRIDKCASGRISIGVVRFKGPLRGIASSGDGCCYSGGDGCIHKLSSRTAYGPTFKEGDIVELVIDMHERRVSYVVNDNDYGPAFTCPSPITPYVALTDEGDEVTFVTE